MPLHKNTDKEILLKKDASGSSSNQATKHPIKKKKEVISLNKDQDYIFTEDDYTKVINNLTKEQNKARTYKNKPFEEYFTKQIKYFMQIYKDLLELNQNKSKLVTLKNSEPNKMQRDTFLFLYNTNKNLNKLIAEAIYKSAELHEKFKKKYKDFTYQGPYLSKGCLIFPACDEASSAESNC